MKIWTKIEWAILSAASILLLLLLILFFYNHPHSDDFSYSVLYAEKGFRGGFLDIFLHNGGRYFSLLLFYINPLKNHNIEGYQVLLIVYFALFCISFGLFFKILFNAFSPNRGIIFLIAFLFLVYISFMPNIHEFVYWYSGNVTYLVAATLWLWALLLHCFLAQEKHEKKIWLWFLCALNLLMIIGCSEAGILLYAVPLLGHILYRKQQNRLKHNAIWLIVVLYFTIAIGISLTAGNTNRQALTPFSGNILLGLSGGSFAAAFWLSKWAMVFMPIVCFYVLVFSHRLKDWAASAAQFRLFKAKNIFISTIIFFWITQVLVVWLSGSTPEHRFENVLFLFLLLAFLFAAQMMVHEQSDFFDMLKGKLHRGFKTLSFIYLLSIFMVVPNHFVDAFWDIATGNAQLFNYEMNKRYQMIDANTDSICTVQPIEAQPKLLYYHTLSCDSTIDIIDVPRLALADYFGKKWIYEYPCAKEATEYTLKDILKKKRTQFFSEKK